MATRNPASTSWGNGSLSHYWQGFKNIPGGWPWDFWSINSTTPFLILFRLFHFILCRLNLLVDCRQHLLLLKFNGPGRLRIFFILSGWWFNQPISFKYAQVKLLISNLPQVSGWKFPKYVKPTCCWSINLRAFFFMYGGDKQRRRVSHSQPTHPPAAANAHFP